MQINDLIMKNNFGNNKNIGIITHYDVHNHGALLQLTALIRVLQKKGINASALQFDKNYDFMGRALKAKYEISAKSVGIYIKYLKEKGIGCTKFNFKKRQVLNKYKQDSGIIGDYYSDSPDLDAVIVGSDEVFALHTGPTPVFFGLCLPTDNVFSYAGSFGPTTYEEIVKRHCIPFIKTGLANMKGVSVRDENSAQIVEKILGETPPIVVDPVLLYGYKDEIASLPISDEKYLLIYAYDDRMNDPEEVNAIRAYAKRKGLKIVSPGFYHSWCDENINVDPIELLGYFKNAKEVITDTFHGCVMSLITEANVAVKTRDSNYFKLSNLLSEYGLSMRLLQNWSDLDTVMAHEIDYDKVNKEIERRRNESMNILVSFLNKCGIN